MRARARAICSRLGHLRLWLRFAAQAFVGLALGGGSLLVVLGGDAVQGALLGCGALLAGLAARRSAARAGDARRAARVRAAVRRALRPLRSTGWRLEEALAWPGGGRLDFLAATPDGRLAFALLASPVRSERLLDRAQEIASWLATSGRPCVPVLAVSRLARPERDERGVLVVAADAVADAVADAESGFHRALAGTQRELAA
jgi:hypothetical protein